MSESNADLEKENERLKAELTSKEYGLVWLDVPEGIENISDSGIPTLVEDQKMMIKTGSSRKPHLLIEGDNYHALFCLNVTHKNAVDLIYIDPPYNTGSDSFRYKDKRYLKKFPNGAPVPKDHPSRHSYWLSFMYKRLVLAKELLKPTGAILISINEEEFAQLKLLCDKVFGAKNYLTMFTIKVRHEERILKGDKDFHEVVEYLLMYRASSEYKVVKKTYDNTSLDDYKYQIVEKTLKPTKVKMGKKVVELFKPGEFEIVKVESGPNNLKAINIRGSIKEGNSSGRFYMEHLSPRKETGYLYKVPNMGDDQFDYRYFVTPAKTSRVNGDYYQGVPVDIKATKEVPYPNYFDFVNAFNNVGYEGGVAFGGGKKPVSFLKHFINLATEDKSAVILDFFGGSGSTGHAVCELNSEDGGTRQFILITNNEEWVKDKKIEVMRKICYPRLVNVAKEHPVEIQFYETRIIKSNGVRAITDDEKLMLANGSSDLIALGERSTNRLERHNNWALYQDSQSTRYVAIYFKEDLSDFDTFLERISELDSAVVVYMFSWGTEMDFEELASLRGVKVKPMPEPIVQTYLSNLDLIGGPR